MRKKSIVQRDGQGLHRRLVPHQAVGLGAPQTIIRRSLPSPDRHNNSVNTDVSCGRVPTTCGEHFSSYRLYVRKLHTGILACIVHNILIFFSHRSLRTFRFIFHFSKFFFSSRLCTPTHRTQRFGLGALV